MQQGKLIGSTALMLLGLSGIPAQAAEGNGWEGFYAGASLGSREQRSVWEPTDSYDPDGPRLGSLKGFGLDDTSEDATAFVGLYGGYNWLVTPRIVLGLELAAGYADNQSSKANIPWLGGTSALDVRVKSDWDANLRGRAGYLITPTLLLYGAGGIAVTRMEATTDCPGGVFLCNLEQSESRSDTLWGWTAGLGAEAQLSERLLARMEYQYSDYGSTSQWAMKADPTQSYGLKNDIDLSTSKLTLGLAYTF